MMKGNTFYNENAKKHVDLNMAKSVISKKSMAKFVILLSLMTIFEIFPPINDYEILAGERGTQFEDLLGHCYDWEDSLWSLDRSTPWLY